jgi:glucose-6-phosphate 1-dehydrogenase
MVVGDLNMKPYKQPDAGVVIIFGAAGDLTSRKLIPAMFNLFLDKWLGEKFAIIGIDRVEMTDDAFRKHLRERNDKLSRRGKADDDLWNNFASRVNYIYGDVNNSEVYKRLVSRLSEIDKQYGLVTNKIFYYAVPPYDWPHHYIAWRSRTWQ